MEQKQITGQLLPCPPFNEIVICHRKWKPTHMDNDGSIKRETVLAKRVSKEPWTVIEDTSRHCWWEGIGNKEGHSWADGTVESWELISLDRAKPTNQDHFAEVSKMVKTSQMNHDLIKRIDEMQEYMITAKFDKSGLAYNLLTDCKHRIQELESELQKYVELERKGYIVIQGSTNIRGHTEKLLSKEKTK